MNYLNGGYVMLDKADSDIFAKASGALQAGKPILWYEDKNTCYFIDTISISGDDIVLTKGGLTITITSGNVVSEVGAIDGLKQYEFAITTADNTYLVTKLLYNVDYPLETSINIDSDLFDYLYNNGVTYHSIAYGQGDDVLYTIADIADDSTYKLTIYNKSGTSSEEAVISVEINKI